MHLQVARSSFGVTSVMVTTMQVCLAPAKRLQCLLWSEGDCTGAVQGLQVSKCAMQAFSGSSCQTCRCAHNTYHSLRTPNRARRCVRVKAEEKPQVKTKEESFDPSGKGSDPPGPTQPDRPKETKSGGRLSFAPNTRSVRHAKKVESEGLLSGCVLAGPIRACDCRALAIQMMTLLVKQTSLQLRWDAAVL